MRRYIVISVLTVILILTGLFIIGCETQGQTGAAVGTGIGAGIGALASRGSAEGTLIGAAVGGGAGYIVGNEADKKQQQQQMQNTQQQMNSILVNIHNSNGSISTVRLTRSGTGYIGPRNEFYDHVPTEAELRPVYGF